MTSQDLNTKSKYKCLICKDTSWILDENNKATRCECFASDLAKSLWNSFGVKSEDVKKLNDYIPYDNTTKVAKEKATEYIRSFNSESKSFGLFGQAGGGKTHIVVAIGSALLNKASNPIPTIYMPYIEVMRELKSNSMDDEYYNKLLGKYQKAKLLIIDDLFKDKVKKGRIVGELAEADIKHIYPIINYRYINKLPTLISSECNPYMLADLDEAIAGRIVEMCGDNVVVFNDAKYNYRMREIVK